MVSGKQFTLYIFLSCNKNAQILKGFTVSFAKNIKNLYQQNKEFLQKNFGSKRVKLIYFHQVRNLQDELFLYH